jgi:hypothetical protein
MKRGFPIRTGTCKGQSTERFFVQTGGLTCGAHAWNPIVQPHRHHLGYQWTSNITNCRHQLPPRCRSMLCEAGLIVLHLVQKARYSLSGPHFNDVDHRLHSRSSNVGGLIASTPYHLLRNERKGRSRSLEVGEQGMRMFCLINIDKCQSRFEEIGTVTAAYAARKWRIPGASQLKFSESTLVRAASSYGTFGAGDGQIPLR